MAYQRKNLTQEQRSELGRKARAARKTWPKTPPELKVSHNIKIREGDWKILSRIAGREHITMAETIHRAAELFGGQYFGAAQESRAHISTEE